MFDPHRVQGIDHCIHHCWQRANRSRFARSFGAERVGRRRHSVKREFECRQVVGARHTVVHKRSREKLARFLIEGDILHYRLANALRPVMSCCCMALSAQENPISPGA